ncbi:MAG: hypothetical protein EPN97_13760 [Alphaproteobacteria bacterium]|nr:MAG: hypothetical protein EPN97_13760 [Alphaproteobacteria bacterium]
MPRCGGPDHAGFPQKSRVLRGGDGDSELMRLLKKFLVFALPLIVVIGLCIHYHIIPICHPITCVPPWKSGQESATYLQELEADLKKRFPIGTEVQAFEVQMLKDGFDKDELNNCHFLGRKAGSQPPNRMCFSKNLFSSRVHSVDVSFVIVYDDNNKISESGLIVVNLIQ